MPLSRQWMPRRSKTPPLRRGPREVRSPRARTRSGASATGTLRVPSAGTTSGTSPSDPTATVSPMKAPPNMSCYEERTLGLCVDLAPLRAVITSSFAPPGRLSCGHGCEVGLRQGSGVGHTPSGQLMVRRRRAASSHRACCCPSGAPARRGGIGPGRAAWWRSTRRSPWASRAPWRGTTSTSA
jgi:hypothetical protein